jgi:hypothetical protein
MQAAASLHQAEAQLLYIEKNVRDVDEALMKAGNETFDKVEALACIGGDALALRRAAESVLGRYPKEWASIRAA